MVEIRVSVADAACAQLLIRRLAGLSDLSSVSFDWTRKEVRVRSEWESRAIVQVNQSVGSWLAAHDVDSAVLSIGDRSYVMLRPEHPATPSGPAT
ncbi:MAG: hypothetical protein ACXVRZ_09885 [Gaiellaceae bacterium]